MAEALANGVIKDCVITVPSYYSQDEKQATQQHNKIATSQHATTLSLAYHTDRPRIPE